mmetsp:Transcript_27106/g.66470  ORF Transcript_27106/g.66470 Transcript_27106/m.66470 type:complete len:268 (-) Transcript_27106:28-831(-)
MATGLLILCIGKATKMVDTFTGMDKCYTGTMKLGEATPSQDAMTAPEETAPWEHITDADIAAGAAGMVGAVSQLPPMYSAIKVGGERLYKAARRGEVVERPERVITVNSFSVTRDAADAQLVHFRVDCSKGTYVRTLAHDLGKHLGSHAHLTALRRESIGEHSVADAWTIEALFASCGVPFREPDLEDYDESKPRKQQPRKKLSRKGSGQGFSRGGDDVGEGGEEGKAEEAAEAAEAAEKEERAGAGCRRRMKSSVEVALPPPAPLC